MFRSFTRITKLWFFDSDVSVYQGLITLFKEQEIVDRNADHRAQPTGVIDFSGNYDDYLRSRGIAIDYQRAASQ